jgi:hypothetical protein
MNNNMLLHLNWNLPLDIQDDAVCKMASMIDINPKDLLQPVSKEYWENAAKVLLKMGYPRIREAIPGLLIWLQDINWPGSNEVMELLKTIPKAELVPYLDDAVKEAISSDDEIWIENLSYFLLQLKLNENDFASKDVYLSLLSGSEFWK